MKKKLNKEGYLSQGKVRKDIQKLACFDLNIFMEFTYPKKASYYSQTAIAERTYFKL